MFTSWLCVDSLCSERARKKGSGLRRRSQRMVVTPDPSTDGSDKVGVRGAGNDISMDQYDVDDPFMYVFLYLSSSAPFLRLFAATIRLLETRPKTIHMRRTASVVIEQITVLIVVRPRSMPAIQVPGCRL